MPVNTQLIFAGPLFHTVDFWIFNLNPDALDWLKPLLKTKKTLSGIDLKQKYSDILIFPQKEHNKKAVIKKIKFQKAADYLRRYIGESQGYREYVASKTLASIKIQCPAPIGYGVNLSPFGQYESVYICEYIEDTLNGIELFNQEKDTEKKNSFFDSTARDLARIHSKGLFHKDGRFGNILCRYADPGDIFWIDNDLKIFKSFSKRYEKIALDRFRKLLSQGFITFKEWKFFQSSYFFYVRHGIDIEDDKDKK